MATPEQQEKLRQAAADTQKEFERLKAIVNQTAEEQRDYAVAAKEAEEANIALGKATGKFRDGTVASKEAITEQSRELVVLARKAKALSKAYDEAIERQERLAGASEELGKELASLIPVLGGNVDFMDTFGGKLAAASEKAGGLGAGISDVAGKFREQFTATKMATNIMAANEEMFAAYIASSFALGIAVDEQAASFARATGMGEKYDEAIMKTVWANQDAGVSVEDAFEAYQTLITTTSKFTDMSASQQSAIAGTVSVLNELGVSSDVSAQNLQIMTTSLNMNAGEAEETSRRLLTAAQAMGVAPQQMAADFSAAGAQFASFGENAVDAFIDLREAAKKTGIELQSLLSITEQFTTFEGAADNVGKLNALLGGPFLNTIDMVTLSLEDPAAALQEVRNAVLDAGLSFEDMNPAMRRAVAAAAGLEDAGQLAALMSGEMDGLGGASAATAKQLEELKEATEFTQSFADELEATRLAFTANFRPLIELATGALNIMQEIAEFLGPTGTMLSTLAVFAITSVVTFTLVRGGIETVVSPIKSVGESLKKLSETLDNMSDESIEKFGDVVKEMSENSKGAGPSLMAIGGAILLIGGGISIAALGMAQFVKAFADLSGEQLLAATAGIVAFGVAFGVFISMLIGLVAGPQAALTGAAIGVILSIGGAVALIGAGIGVAAAGMAMLISSIGDLANTADDLLIIGEIFENLSVPKMVTYTAAMTATAAVGMTPAGMVFAATAAAVGGGGGGGAAAPAAPAKVEVNIKGRMRSLFEVMDKRYVQNKAVTPGAKSNSTYQ